jgi:hypothetical protein
VRHSTFDGINEKKWRLSRQTPMHNVDFAFFYPTMGFTESGAAFAGTLPGFVN